MSSPWLNAIFAGTTVIGLAALVETTEPPEPDAGALDCPLPIAASGTIEAADTTEAEAETTAATTVLAPADAFFDSFCARSVAVAGIDPELTASPRRDQAELFRVGMCAPDVELPDDALAERNWRLFIGGTAQTDPVLGEQWLAADVLDAYEPPESDGIGAAVEINPDALALLVAIDMEFIEIFHENESDWCTDTASVATTEP